MRQRHLRVTGHAANNRSPHGRARAPPGVLALERFGPDLGEPVLRCNSLWRPPDRETFQNSTSAMHHFESMITEASVQSRSAWLRRSGGQRPTAGTATRARVGGRLRPWREHFLNRSVLDHAGGHICHYSHIDKFPNPNTGDMRKKDSCTFTESSWSHEHHQPSITAGTRINRSFASEC